MEGKSQLNDSTDSKKSSESASVLRYNLRNRGPALFELFPGQECPICLENYVLPVIVNCSHAFCSRCVKQLQVNGMFTECPVCKKLLVKALFIHDFGFTKHLASAASTRRKSSAIESKSKSKKKRTRKSESSNV
ncbi:E3 ubiquitin-protein ligase RNF125-like [Anopheles albimanus]|uniref:E3 ubiquitin-protein ligase RNF125-like n=1 Tax=Anopheles albimanus TaxID=7167 RepID=UPI00163FE59A|nr:E3 ubiquitin-protein ligase RNF125-like [Anopheles albimanus]